jgi:hypothetical protein
LYPACPVIFVASWYSLVAQACYGVDVPSRAGRFTVRDITMRVRGMTEIIGGTIGLLLIVVFFFIVNGQSQIPLKWTDEMKVVYSISHGMSGEFLEYELYHDTLTVYRRWQTSEGRREESYGRYVGYERCERLLKVMRMNRLDRVRAKNSGVTIYDGAAFSFRFTENDHEIINLSNSAHDQLNKEGGLRLQAAVAYLDELGQP